MSTKLLLKASILINVSLILLIDQLDVSSTEHPLILWHFPPKGKMKINTDGSCFNNPTYESFGGFVRSDQGKWIEGFRCFIRVVLQAELWWLRQALRIAQKKEWNGILTESKC